MITFIPPDRLVDRRIYRIRSRNLIIGAWSAEALGFVGLREKFGVTFLFTEYEHDLMGPPHGTARAIDDLGMNVPEDVSLQEHLRSPNGRLVINQPLFDLLTEHEPVALALHVAEQNRWQREAREREAAMTPEQKAERTRLARERIDDARRRFAERDKRTN